MFDRFRTEIASRWRALFDRDGRRAELEDEVRMHLEMETEDLVRRGVEPAEARRRAAAEFGAVPKVLEECREEWGFSWIEDTTRDMRFGLRSLLRAPRFSGAAVLSLGLGLAATLLVYALVEAVVLRPLPLEESDRLVRLWELTPEGNRFSTSDLNVVDFRQRATLLDGIAFHDFTSPALLLELGEVNRRVVATPVSGNYFRVLGVEMLHGRSWTDAETAPGTAHRSVVIGYDLWRSLFSGDFDDPEIRLGGERWRVLGVTPPGFRFGPTADLWLPETLNLDRNRGDHRLSALARLAEGATVESAEEQILGIAAELASTYPEQKGWSGELQPIQDWAIGPHATRTSYALAGSVVLLLILACISVSGLLMARSTARRDEMALRRALGAGRGRLIRQLLAESAWIGLAGVVIGWILASTSLPFVRSAAGSALPRIDEMTLSPVALAVALVAMLTTTFGVGLLPAWRASASAAGSRRGLSSDNRVRSMLVVCQMALALVLVACCLTLVTSYQRLNAVDPGFEIAGLRAGHVSLTGERYSEQSRAVRDFYTEVLETLNSTPGIESAGASTLRPFVGFDLHNTVGKPDWQDKSSFLPVLWRAVMPGTFRTMGLPLLAGRDFEDEEGELVTIVSASLAEQLYGTLDVIGKPVRWIYPQGPVSTIVGVVADVRDLDPTAPIRPTYYWSERQMGWPGMALLVRSELDSATLQGVVHEAVRSVDSTLPPVELHSTERDLADVISTSKLSTTVFTVFAGFAFLIAIVGLYGLIAFTAASRRAEIGLRIALGSRPAAVSSLFVRQAVGLVAIGAVVGLGALLLVARPLSELLFETSSLEPLVLFATVILFGVAAVVASVGPALRVARRDPVRHLREA